MSIKWYELSSQDSERLEQFFSLYDEAFSLETREPHSAIMNGFRYSEEQFPNRFHLLVGYEGDELVVLSVFHYFALANAGFIVYLATQGEKRSKGIGTVTLNKIEEILLNDSRQAGFDSLKAIVLETEIAEHVRTEEEKINCFRRKRFYEKNGFKLYEDIPYYQPPLHKDMEAVPMRLCIKQYGKKPLSLCYILILILAIYFEKYRLVNEMDSQELEGYLQKVRRGVYPMNETIETILRHRSIRSFEEKPLSEEQIKTIVSCAQAASTSSYIQAYSIIGVTDPHKKKKLAEIVGNQPYVEKNGHFFVFCADLYRHSVAGQLEGMDVTPSLESTEKFMVALIDTALAAQNAALAAESMGLGICYIGGIRNNLEEVEKILGTPERVIPLFGLAVGYPKNPSSQKPRLPYSHVYHENTYELDDEKYMEELKMYDEIVSEYYKERTGGKRQDTWTGQMAKMLDKKSRMYMKEFVEGKKMNLR